VEPDNIPFHHITVDVEEFFHSTLLVEKIPPHTWNAYPRRAGTIVPWILERLEASGNRATFFVLGWTAERDPGLIQEISRAGHEVAAHSWIHRRVDRSSPDDFRESIRRCKALLEDITGSPVIGYRAPSFSISPGCEWAFDILLEEGYRYDSSIFPIDLGPGYGYRGASRDPYWVDRSGGRLFEVPLLTLQFLGRRFPAAGGAYLRLMPFSLVTAALRQAQQRNAQGTLYIHPWDLDPEIIPLASLPRVLRLRLYGGTARARRRMPQLLNSYNSLTIAESLNRSLDSGSLAIP